MGNSGELTKQNTICKTKSAKHGHENSGSKQSQTNKRKEKRIPHDKEGQGRNKVKDNLIIQ